MRILLPLAAVCLMLCGSHALAEPMIVNGDFESDTAGFSVWPGYVNQEGTNPANISGWTGPPASVGINPISSDNATPAPFRDNGDNDTHVAFLQGDSYIEQVVSGFTPGNEYTLGLDFNSRNCCGDVPVAEILIDGTLAGSSVDLLPPDGGITPVGESNPWYHADVAFTASAESHTIRIGAKPLAGGDATLVVDNVSIVPEPTSGLLAAFGCLALGLMRRRR